jgi:hypothetical protein
MTPQEISDYKRRWQTSERRYTKYIHSDRRNDAREWCKETLKPHQWHHQKFTDVYEDSVSFESRVHYLYFVEWYGWKN